MLADNIFQGHVGHPALSAGEDPGPPKLLPGKVRIRLPGHQEGAVPAGQLGKDLGVVLLPLIVDIDGSLRPGKADLHVVRENGGHHLVGPLAVGEFDLDACIVKEAQVDGGVLRGVKNRMGHLTETDLFLRLWGCAAPCQGQEDQDGGKEDAQNSFHG